MNARAHPAADLSDIQGRTSIAREALADLQAMPQFDAPLVATTKELRTSMRRWGRSSPNHDELAGVFFLMAEVVKQIGYLSDKCCASVVDQLQELANEVDQDEVNQRAES